MQYAAEMESVAMVYIPSFIKIDSGFQKLLGGSTDTPTQTRWRSHKATRGKWAKNNVYLVQVVEKFESA
jgi:hypothetical protein